MSFNGSGTYVLASGNPVTTGTTISSTWANNTLNDIANNGLSYCLTKDGQTVPTANLPMGGYKLTGMGDANASGNALNYGQASWSLAAGTLTGALTGTAATFSSTLGVTGAMTGTSLALSTTLGVTGATTVTTLAATGAITATGGGSFGTAAYTFTDSFFQIVGSVDNTKKAVFEVDGLTTATTRTVTVPDRNITLNELTSITASLSADVDLNNTGNYFLGPSVAQGTAGTWYVQGTVTMKDTAGAAVFYVKLWDGTTVIASGAIQSGAAGANTSLSLSGYLATPAGDLRISVRDITNAAGKILFNETGNSKDSTITAIRIA